MDFIASYQIFPFKDFLNTGTNYSLSRRYIFLLMLLLLITVYYFPLPATTVDLDHEASPELSHALCGVNTDFGARLWAQISAL